MLFPTPDPVKRGVKFSHAVPFILRVRIETDLFNNCKVLIEMRSNFLVEFFWSPGFWSPEFSGLVREAVIDIETPPIYPETHPRGVSIDSTSILAGLIPFISMPNGRRADRAARATRARQAGSHGSPAPRHRQRQHRSRWLNTWFNRPTSPV
jgi:hypothetical protein